MEYVAIADRFLHASGRAIKEARYETEAPPFHRAQSYLIRITRGYEEMELDDREPI